MLTESAWRIARLSFCFGGLGVRAIADYADAAFVTAHINVMYRAVMEARARILLRTPDAADVVDA